MSNESKCESKDVLMSKEELKFIVENRKYVRGKTTRVCNRISNEYPYYNIAQCDESIEDLKNFKDRLAQFDKKISSGLWLHESDRSKFDSELESCVEYAEKITMIIRILDSHKKTSHISEPMERNIPELILRAPKLPEIPLPFYSHTKNEIIEEFITRFETILCRSPLNDLEKFSYLEQQLSGEPLELIRSLHGVDRSYTEAKDLLLRAFSSPTLQKFDIIKRLVSPNARIPSDTYKFIGEMRSIIALFKTCDIQIELVLKYFIWNALPENFKNQFIHIVNKNIPSLADIENHIFEAAERYSHSSKSTKSDCLTAFSQNLEVNLHGLAVNISKS